MMRGIQLILDAPYFFVLTVEILIKKDYTTINLFQQIKRL